MPLENYTEAFPCDETGGTDALVGVYGYSWSHGGGGDVDSQTGKVPDTTPLARGPYEPIGAITGNRYHRETSAGIDDIFDIRGVTSFTLTQWVKRYAGNSLGTTLGSMYDVSSASRQAFTGRTRTNAQNSPSLFMMDGVTAFAGVQVYPNILLAMPDDEWQFFSYGYDAVRNKIFAGWGRGAGDWQYNEEDGLAAGFLYSLAPSLHMGYLIPASPFTNGSDQRVDVDQVVWYQGQALTEDDLQFIWNNHDARLLSAISPGGGFLSHYNRVQRRKARYGSAT